MAREKNPRKHPLHGGPVRVLLLTLMISGIGVKAAQAFHAVSDREIMVGDTLPVRSLLTLDSQSMEVPAGTGLTVVLFWAMWSPRSMPALDLWQELGRDYSGHPLHIVAVNAEREDLSPSDREEILRFVEDKEIDLPVVMDDGLLLYDEFGLKAIPTAFFLNGEGVILYRYASFPTSAPEDLREEVEIHLGLRERETEEERDKRGKLAYQPKNNALLYYNMGVQLHKKGLRDKALERFFTALQLDPEYTDPIRTLEGIYFADGRTPGAEEELGSLLTQNGLEMLVERIGEGDPIVLETRERTDPGERMRRLMGDPEPGSGE